MDNLNFKLLIAILVVSTIALSATSCCAKSRKIDNTPVSAFELEKFLGKWYEIARFDHKFERGLDSVTAEYSVKDDGMVKVLNSGWKDGEFSQAEGKAKVVDPEKKEGYLKVAFFWIFYADYRILYLDEDYSYALIGSKRDNYLWIMSRAPILKEDVREAILAEARRRGYDTDLLIWVEQS